MTEFHLAVLNCDRLALEPFQGPPMTEQPRQTFESALAGRVAAMADACTQCGKCFEACPITEAAGVADAEPRAVLAGVVDILRHGDGNEAARKWASSCRPLRRMHQGLRLRRQSALHAGDGAHHHGAGRARAARAAPDRRRRFPQGRARRDQHLAHAAGRRVAGAAWAEDRQPEGRAPARTRGRTSSSTPAATCSRRRTSRCSRSTSWTPSAPPIR